MYINITSSINIDRVNIRWNISKYCVLTERCLHDIHIPTEAVGCRDTHCMNVNHIKSLNKLYNDTVNSLIQAGEELAQNNKSYTNKLGWAVYVDSLYDTSREDSIALCRPIHPSFGRVKTNMDG